MLSAILCILQVSWLITASERHLWMRTGADGNAPASAAASDSKASQSSESSESSKADDAAADKRDNKDDSGDEEDSKSSSKTPRDDPQFMTRGLLLTLYLPLGPEMPIKEHSELIQRCFQLFAQGKIRPRKPPPGPLLRPLAGEPQIALVPEAPLPPAPKSAAEKKKRKSGGSEPDDSKTDLPGQEKEEEEDDTKGDGDHEYDLTGLDEQDRKDVDALLRCKYFTRREAQWRVRNLNNVLDVPEDERWRLFAPDYDAPDEDASD